MEQVWINHIKICSETFLSNYISAIDAERLRFPT